MQKDAKDAKKSKKVSKHNCFLLSFLHFCYLFLNFTIPKTRKHISIFCNNHNKKNTMWHCKIHITDSNICNIHIWILQMLDFFALVCKIRLYSCLLIFVFYGKQNPHNRFQHLQNTYSILYFVSLI